MKDAGLMTVKKTKKSEYLRLVANIQKKREKTNSPDIESCRRELIDVPDIPNTTEKSSINDIVGVGFP